jgi:GT2 family glycosyltransferase
LNLAIAQSSFEIICRIDGHSEISNSYLKTAVSIMQEKGAVNVGGLMYADGQSGLQRTIAQAMRSKLGVGASKFHTGGTAGPSDTVYLGTFKKSAILAAGGFDERYIRAQDWELNHRMRAQGGLIWFDPRLVVTYRPRKSLTKLAKQYFQYGRWRRVISRQHPKTTNFRYLAPPVALVINLLSVLFGVLVTEAFFLPVLIYMTLIIIGGAIIGKKFADKLLMPIVFATMHLSWGAGFITSPKKLFKN